MAPRVIAARVYTRGYVRYIGDKLMCYTDLIITNTASSDGTLSVDRV